MQHILRRYIGRGGVSVKDVAIVAQSKRWGSKERRVRAWMSGTMEPKATELLALMQLLDDDFVNEILVEIGYTAEPIKGFVNKEQLGHGINEVLAGEYFTQPGNGPKRVRVLLRLRRLVGGYLNGLRQRRAAA